MGNRIAILQANLGSFDETVDPVEQTIPTTFHRWTDENFPPIAGLTPRLQYRIPKTHGWQMFPGYDYYIWLDGAYSFTEPNCAEWWVNQLGDNDIALFAHPNRKTIKQEVEHIEEHLKAGKPYITDRYKGGLHREQYDEIMENGLYPDKKLYASTAFIYRNSPKTQVLLKDWWNWGSRYFTCDQVVLPWLFWLNVTKVKTLKGGVDNCDFIQRVSHHK